jgi:hypothetical protein
MFEARAAKTRLMLLCRRHERVIVEDAQVFDAQFLGNYERNGRRLVGGAMLA